jgi:type IV secretory pathway TraG/TraD family ATPase VirD4
MSKPTHRAYVVVEPKEGSDRKATWVEVGAVWQHKSGKGFDLVIPPGISVSGRIVCTEPKEKTAEFEAAIQEQMREMSSK